LVAHGIHAKKADSLGKKGEHSRTAQQQAKAIAARFLYMVVLYMARKKKRSMRGHALEWSAFYNPAIEIILQLAETYITPSEGFH